MSRLQQLAERRAVLVDRLAFLRQDLANEFRQLEQRSGFVDKGFSLAQSVRAHPKLAVASGLAALFLLRKHMPFGLFTGTALTVAKTGLSFAKNKLFARKSHAETD